MLLVYDTSTDVTAAVKQGTVSISDTMGSRRALATFRTIGTKIDHGRSVYIYEALSIRQSSSSGTDVLYVDDTYPDTEKWRAGDEILVDIKGVDQMKYTIDSVDHAARTITLTENLASNVTKGTTKVGRLIFGGVTLNVPDEEIGPLSGVFEYGVRCADWSNLYDRKAVTSQFENKYPREILGRVVYGFCANDTSLDLETFEAAWTASGQANAMADETTDRLQGSKSQKTSTSGVGTGIWTKTISSKDLSSYTNLRLWWKVAAGEGVKMTSLKVRVGDDASNYFEFSLSNIGTQFEDCWNFDSMILGEHDAVVGTPDLSDVTWIQIRVGCSSAIAANSLFFDHLHATTGSFTLQNTVRGDTKFLDVRAAYKKPSVLTDELAKQGSLFWYIDIERDLHLFSSADVMAPFSLDDTSQNYSNLELENDISKLRNRQVVKGGDAPGVSLYTQNTTGDGARTSFTLDYKPKTLTMTVAGVPQDLGVEGFVDESTVEWIYNFEEKIIRKTASGATPADGDAIVFTYYPYFPIRVAVTSPSSIAAMQALTGGDGVYDGPLINDPSISSVEDARARGRAELELYANAVRTITFETDIDGLRAGQTLEVTDTQRSISAEEFLIQSVRYKQQFGDRFKYTVTASTTIFGLIEFIQMLLKRASALTVSPSELVDTILTLDETITLADVITPTALDKTVYAGIKKKKTFDFVGLSGSVTADGTVDNGKQWYADFIDSETGTVQFATSNHNNNAELRLTATTGGGTKEVQARTVNRFDAVPSTLYTVAAWIEIQAALTNIGTNGGFKMVVKEWAAKTGGSALATNTIFSEKTAVQDFAKVSSTFTSHASTAWISVEISILAASGTARIADVILTPSTTETATLAAVADFCQAV